MKFLDIQKQVECKDVLRCVFNLKQQDIEVYHHLKERGTMRADDLAQVLHKERSTVYRSLQKLTSCGLCVKQKKIIEGGGYYFSYCCNDMNNTKEIMETCLDRWYEEVKKTIQDIDLKY